MKNNIEMMRDIREETYKQIGANLSNDEFLITSLTIYDKNNSLAVNLFLTNTAIFMQESTEIEKIKKRLFIKIIDIKLTSDEFYIEFQNGYKIIGDTTDCQEEVNRFFECIRVNTTIKTSSTKELDNISYEMPEDKIIPRSNPFESLKPKETVEEKKEPTFVKTLTDIPEEESVKKKKPIGLFIGIGIGALLLITTIIIVVILLTGKKEEISPEVLAIQNRTEEVLEYQLDNNAMYDYLFELTGYFEEYEAGFTSQSKLDIESAFDKLKINYDSKFKEKKYSSSSNAYKIYEVKKVDEWMNEGNLLLEEIFALYEEIIDEDYRDDENIISLQSKLSNADTKIRKIQDCLTEEKTELNKLLGIEDDSSNKEENTINKNSEKNEKIEEESSSETKEETSEDKTDIKEEDNSKEDLSYENEESDIEEPVIEGKQEEAAFVSE